jgi:hypothetical protein
MWAVDNEDVYIILFFNNMLEITLLSRSSRTASLIRI